MASPLYTISAPAHTKLVCRCGTTRLVDVYIGFGVIIPERIGSVESVYIHLLRHAPIATIHIDGMDSEISGAEVDEF